MIEREAIALLEDAAVTIVLDLGLKRGCTGVLDPVDVKRLVHASTWLRTYTDGQRVDPSGTPLDVVGVLRG
jgi:hypothetical protein